MGYSSGQLTKCGLSIPGVTGGRVVVAITDHLEVIMRDKLCTLAMEAIVTNLHGQFLFCLEGFVKRWEYEGGGWNGNVGGRLG